MDLLLDVNIVVDLLANRQPFAQHAADVLDRCHNNGSRIWLYTGSVQTLEYVLAEELSRNSAESFKLVKERARILLNLIFQRQTVARSSCK
jgi:UDP-2-acetamido-2-deoxy-ribo-hexuluronate aminotransferase